MIRFFSTSSTLNFILGNENNISLTNKTLYSEKKESIIISSNLKAKKDTNDEEEKEKEKEKEDKYYSIPNNKEFIITLGKHNTCIDESFLSNDINIEEKLNLICDQNKTLCLLIDVIKDSLNSIKTYSQTYEEKMDDITLKYQNVYNNK